MSNVSGPLPESLPSSRSLRRATIIAIVIAIVLVVVVILPAERGIDLTGIGNLIGLKEMGTFKVEAARELEEDAAMLAKWKADSIAGRTAPLNPPGFVSPSDSAQKASVKPIPPAAGVR